MSDEYKVGDKVALRSSSSFGFEYEITTIEKVTPTGQLVLQSGQRINKRRRVVGATGYHAVVFEGHVTDKIRAAHRRERILGRLRSTDWSALSNDGLEDVFRIVEAAR